MSSERTYKYVDLSGYGFSGKSAVIDLLREFRGYHVPSSAFEFCLLRIQGGILDLEDALSRDWSPIRSDAAIRRFKRTIRRLGVTAVWRNPRTWFAGAGWNYDDAFSHRFIDLSDEYVQRLVQATWVTDWPFPKADVTGLELFLRRSMRKLGMSGAYDVPVYLSFPEDFVSITKDYLNSLLSSNVDDSTSTVVMHNAFEPFQPQRCLKFFNEARCIIIDRDPRDSYVQQLSYRPMAVGPRNFILRYRAYREAAKRFHEENAAILRIRFEDLITNYQSTVDKIVDFLGEPASVHVNPKRYMNPDASSKNMGIWKTHDSHEIDQIYRELGEYCFD